MIKEILKKVEEGIELSKEDAITLLQVDNTSTEFYQILSKANQKSREMYQNKGYIFAQMGLNAKPCTGNCKFCSLGIDNFVIKDEFEKSMEEIIETIQSINFNLVDSIFLMTTADYDEDKYLKIAKEVKKIIPPHIQLVANIGDFHRDYAKKLKDIGFDAVYHILRLGEGHDTDIAVETRMRTLDAIKAVGLDLYYCIEPIGKEHTYSQIVDEMIRAREYNVDVMAVMGRVGVPGTKFEYEPELSEIELTKIVAVTRLVTNPKKSMNIHEPKMMALLAGVNQLYAEIGVNPRDTEKSTEKHRGITIKRAKKILEEAEYSILQ